MNRRSYWRVDSLWTVRARSSCLKIRHLSSLAGRDRGDHNPTMDEAAQAPVELPLRPQDEVECRRCEVHCDKVVYPGACIERSCPFVYAYEAWGHTYVGCMQRVYAVEIDLDLLRAAEAKREGFGGDPRHRRTAADVQGRGVALLREPRRRARLPATPSSTRSRASGRASA